MKPFNLEAAQADQATTIAELETELKVTDIVQRAKLEQLQAWKDAAIQVESEWDDQAVGKALNIELGKSIRANILPKIAQLQLDNAKMREALKSAIECMDGFNMIDRLNGKQYFKHEIFKRELKVLGETHTLECFIEYRKVIKQAEVKALG